MYDPDAIKGTHWHWIISNIEKNDIKNGVALLEYTGPNPPDDKRHRYFFELYGSNQPFSNDKWKERNLTLEEGKKRLALIGKPLLMNKFLSRKMNREEEKKRGGKNTKKRIRKNKKTCKVG